MIRLYQSPKTFSVDGSGCMQRRALAANWGSWLLVYSRLTSSLEYMNEAAALIIAPRLKPTNLDK